MNEGLLMFSDHRKSNVRTIPPSRSANSSRSAPSGITLVYCASTPATARTENAVGGFVTGTQRLVVALSGMDSTKVRLVELSSGRLPPALRLARDSWRLLVVLVRNPRARIVLVQDGQGAGVVRTLVLSTVARLLGKTAAVEVRGGKAMDWLPTGRAPFWQRAVYRLASVAAQAYVVQVRAIADAFDVFGKPVFWLPNFISQASLVRRTTYPSRLVVTYAGALHRDKGVLEAAQAIRKAIEQSIPITVHWAGTGPELDAVQAILPPSSDVIYHGKLAEEGVRALLRVSLLLIFPTRWPGEGHPNILNEALAEGVAIAATDHNFNRQVLQEVPVYWLSQAALEESILYVIRQASADLADAESRGVRGREFIQANYLDTTWVPRLLDFLYEITPCNSPPPSGS